VTGKLRSTSKPEDPTIPGVGRFRTGFPVVGVGDSGEAERSFRKESERHSGMIPNTIGA